GSWLSIAYMASRSPEYAEGRLSRQSTSLGRPTDQPRLRDRGSGVRAGLGAHDDCGATRARVAVRRSGGPGAVECAHPVSAAGRGLAATRPGRATGGPARDLAEPPD